MTWYSDNTYKRMVVTGNTVHIAVNYYGGEGGAWYGVLGYLRSTNNGASFEPIRPLLLPDQTRLCMFMDDSSPPATVRSPSGSATSATGEVNNAVLPSRTAMTAGTNFTQRTVYSTTTGTSW